MSKCIFTSFITNANIKDLKLDVFSLIYIYILYCANAIVRYHFFLEEV